MYKDFIKGGGTRVGGVSDYLSCNTLAPGKNFGKKTLQFFNGLLTMSNVNVWFLESCKIKQPLRTFLLKLHFLILFSCQSIVKNESNAFKNMLE